MGAFWVKITDDNTIETSLHKVTTAPPISKSAIAQNLAGPNV